MQPGLTRRGFDGAAAMMGGLRRALRARKTLCHLASDSPSRSVRREVAGHRRAKPHPAGRCFLALHLPGTRLGPPAHRTRLQRRAGHAAACCAASSLGLLCGLCGLCWLCLRTDGPCRAFLCALNFTVALLGSSSPASFPTTPRHSHPPRATKPSMEFGPGQRPCQRAAARALLAHCLSLQRI